MLVDWRDFDSFYLVKEPNHKEARDLFQLLFDVAPGKHKIEILTTSMIDPAKHKLVVGEQSSTHALSLARTITLALALALTLAQEQHALSSLYSLCSLCSLCSQAGTIGPSTRRPPSGCSSGHRSAGRRSSCSVASREASRAPPKARVTTGGTWRRCHRRTRSYSMSKARARYSRPTSLKGLIGRGWPDYDHHTYLALLAMHILPLVLGLTMPTLYRFRFNLPVNRGCMRRILRDQQGWLDRINLKPQFQVE